MDSVCGLVKLICHFGRGKKISYSLILFSGAHEEFVNFPHTKQNKIFTLPKPIKSNYNPTMYVRHTLSTRLSPGPNFYNLAVKLHLFVFITKATFQEIYCFL